MSVVMEVMEVASIFVETPSQPTTVHANKASYCTKTTTIAKKEAVSMKSIHQMARFPARITLITIRQKKTVSGFLLPHPDIESN